MSSRHYNPEKKDWRGKSHRTGERVRDMKEKINQEEIEEKDSTVTTSKLQKFMDEKKIFHLEGSSGTKNLCRIAREIQGEPIVQFGQFDRDGSYGDLIDFLDDNPGAQEAILEFMFEFHDCEIEENEEEECKHESGPTVGGICGECGAEI